MDMGAGGPRAQLPGTARSVSGGYPEPLTRSRSEL